MDDLGRAGFAADAVAGDVGLLARAVLADSAQDTLNAIGLIGGEAMADDFGLHFFKDGAVGIEDLFDNMRAKSHALVADGLDGRDELQRSAGDALPKRDGRSIDVRPVFDVGQYTFGLTFQIDARGLTQA